MRANDCLNPCFNGIWVERELRPSQDTKPVIVLILVLMEYGLKAWLITKGAKPEES